MLWGVRDKNVEKIPTSGKNKSIVLAVRHRQPAGIGSVSMLSQGKNRKNRKTKFVLRVFFSISTMV